MTNSRDHLIDTMRYGDPQNPTTGEVSCVCGWNASVPGFDPDGIADIWLDHRKAMGITRSQLSMVRADGMSERWGKL